jgi:hypothetical protein
LKGLLAQPHTTAAKSAMKIGMNWARDGITAREPPEGAGS